MGNSTAPVTPITRNSLMTVRPSGITLGRRGEEREIRVLWLGGLAIGVWGIALPIALLGEATSIAMSGLER